MRRRSALLGAVLLAGCGAGESAPLEAPPLAAQQRPDTPGNTLLFKFRPEDVVETFGSPGGKFLVHFTRQGPNAVPAADADSSGVPDFVEQVAGVYDEVIAKYHDDLGFRAPLGDESLPDNGGDGRFDVYLVDFAGKGDGNYQNDTCGPANQDQCAGYMIQENDFAGYGYPSTSYANRILGSHEFFHAIQAAYDDGQGSVAAEGSAVWATEQFDPSLDDFESFLPGFLDNPDRPLDSPLPGPVDPKSYGSGLFFEFLEERYGAGTVRAFWERCENGADGEANPAWFTELDPLVKSKGGTGFADMLTDFVTWNLFTGKFADPTRAYASGAGYPAVKMNAVTAPYFKDALRVFYASAQYYRVPPEGRAAMTAAVVAPADSPTDTDDLRVLLATQATSTYDPVKLLADPTAGTETIDTGTAKELVVVVINTAQKGDSRKPALCIGTSDEVAACRASFLGGAGGGGGGGGGGSAAKPAAKDASGCGCRVGGEEPSAPAAAILAGLAIALYRRRKPAR